MYWPPTTSSITYSARELRKVEQSSSAA
jgi:hypothetical protein